MLPSKDRDKLRQISPLTSRSIDFIVCNSKLILKNEVVLSMKSVRRKVLSVVLVMAMVYGSMASLVTAALPADALTLKSNLEAIYAHADSAVIDAANTEIITILGNVNRLSEFSSVSSEYWTAINAKQGGDSDPITELAVLDFVLHIGLISFDPDLSTLQNYIMYNQAFLNDLSILGGLTGFDEATYGGLLQFYNDIATATRSTIRSMPSTFSDMSALVQYKSQLVANVQAALDGTSSIATMFDTIGITANDIVNARISLMLKSTSVAAAELELAKAYKAVVGSTTNNGETPPVDEKETPPATLPEQASETAKEVLEDLKEKLADLPKNELKGELKKAEKAVEKAIKEAGKLTVTSVVTAGVAKPTIDTTAIVNKAKEAKAQADTLNADLVASGGKKAKVEVTMDMGIVEADDVEIPLSKVFLNDMSDEGVDTVAVAVNGVEITIDSNEFEEDTTLSIQKKSKEESGDVSGKPVASDYYNFEFTSNGNEVVEFKKPVTLKLPIADTSNYDTDLLTLAKIINGKLEYYGGKYNSEGKYFQGSRNSFSTYAIVENKVEFIDTASVMSWAGRSIDVAAAKGILEGRGDGVFDPTANVTRAEFAKMLVTAFSVSSFNSKEAFLDVREDDWFKPYVATAFSNGIISGRTATTFDPNSSITRQEMAAMVARILKSSLDETDATDANAELSIYSDADKIGSVFKASVALATEQGILSGSAGTFKPLGITTRAEAAVVISKLIELL